MGNGSSASNKNGALKETLGDHEERLVSSIELQFFREIDFTKKPTKTEKNWWVFLKTYFI